MKRLLVAGLALALAPAAASAEALAREGTVAILPGATLPRMPDGMSSGPAPAGTLAFGFKPMAAMEVGIDIGGALIDSSKAGKDWRIVGAPLLLRFSWTPTPGWDVRPVFQAGAGKALISVDGPAGIYREHTPFAAMAAAGIQADLSDRIGLALDVGYLHARATDPSLGSVDGGGPLVRGGIYFRWEPIPEHGISGL